MNPWSLAAAVAMTCILGVGGRVVARTPQRIGRGNTQQLTQCGPVVRTND